MSSQKKDNKRRDSASFVDENGVETNSLLHEQIVDGVDDADLRKATAISIVADGRVSKSAAERAYGVTINDDELPARTPEFTERRKSFIKIFVTEMIAQELPQTMIDRLIDDDEDISHAELMAVQEQIESDIEQNGCPTEEELIQEIERLNLTS